MGMSADLTLSRASSLPQRMCQSRIHMTPHCLWETSEVTRAANAVGQPMGMSADSTPSRASSLLPRLCEPRIPVTPQYLWETSEVTRVWAAFRTNTVGQPVVMLADSTPLRASSLLPRLCQPRIPVTPQPLYETSETPEGVLISLAPSSGDGWNRRGMHGP
jgi:hypothetical protein